MFVAGFLGLYMVYVIIVLCSRFWESKNKPKSEVKVGPGGHKITFEGISPDDDPTSGMVVMKGFLLYPDGVPVKDFHGNNNNDDLETANNYTRKYESNNLKSNTDSRLKNINDFHSNSQLRNNSKPQSILSISRSIPDIRIDSFPKGRGEALNNNDDNESVYDSMTYNTTVGLTGIITAGGCIKRTPVNNFFNKNLSVINNSDSNQLTITSMKSVSICEDNNSIYDTVTSFDAPKFPRSVLPKNNMSRRSSRVSILSGSSIQKVRRASKDFLEKITPIDKSGWKHRNWGGKSLEVIKAPIRFFLLLTTPCIDVDPHATPTDNDSSHVEVDRVEWNKPLSILHCITGPLFVIFATGYGLVWIGDAIPLAVIVFLVAGGVSSLMIFTSKYETPPSYYKTYCSFLGFIVGVVWVYFISTEVVCNIRALGVAFNLTEPTIGMTILALGNCLLDFISNVSIAKKGYPRMAIGACLGSPLLALLLGVGIPATIKTATNAKRFIELEPTTLLVVIYIAIVGSLGVVVIITAALKWEAKRWLGYLMIVLYFTVIFIVFLVEFKVIPVAFTHVLYIV
jgi:sodium/potassium/calcium exchanger 6